MVLKVLHSLVCVDISRVTDCLSGARLISGQRPQRAAKSFRSRRIESDTSAGVLQLLLLCIWSARCHLRGAVSSDSDDPLFTSVRSAAGGVWEPQRPGSTFVTEPAVFGCCCNTHTVGFDPAVTLLVCSVSIKSTVGQWPRITPTQSEVWDERNSVDHFQRALSGDFNTCFLYKQALFWIKCRKIIVAIIIVITLLLPRHNQNHYYCSEILLLKVKYSILLYAV